ncbi:MAG: polysialyltransferase family glycosyltransferase, partial [Oscillospiraceae bacterium]|nr:polysialyltransferase family glycosyltransferase [Oscillospiraceae bacterium]
EDEGTHLKGNVCILSHTQAGFILDVNSFSFNSPDIEVSKYTDGVNENLVTKLRNNLTVSRELKKLHSNGSDFYILATVYPKYQWHAFVSQNCPGKRPISVLVDEGLGMYMRSTRDWIMESWFSKDRFYKKVKYTYEFCYGRPKKEKQLKSKNELIFYGLFYTKDMTINTKVAEYYKKVLLDEKKLVRHEVPSYYENSVVINTQPYYDEGQLESEADTSLIKQICRACSQEGYTVVLKPHPREKSLDRYSCIEDCIMDTDYMLSQESI